MNILYKNLHRRVLRTSIIITIGLIFCSVLIQSSKFMHLISGSYASIGQFLNLIFYLLVDVIANILPISFAISVAITFFRFRISNQLVVLQALGIPTKKLITSILPSSLAVCASLLFITLYLSPHSLQKFKVIEAQILNNVSLPKHSGNLLNHNGISVFAEKYSDKLIFENLIIIDKRVENNIRTYRAKSGFLNKKFLVLNQGEIVEYDLNKKKILVTKFKKHIYNLSSISSKYKINLRIHEMSTTDLLGSLDLKKRAEFNSRILNPFVALLLVFIAFLVTLKKDYYRSVSEHPLLLSIASIILCEGIYLGLSNACQKYAIFIPITYIFVFGSILIVLLFINKILKQ